MKRVHIQRVRGQCLAAVLLLTACDTGRTGSRSPAQRAYSGGAEESAQCLALDGVCFYPGAVSAAPEEIRAAWNAASTHLANMVDRGRDDAEYLLQREVLNASHRHAVAAVSRPRHLLSEGDESAVAFAFAVLAAVEIHTYEQLEADFMPGAPPVDAVNALAACVEQARGELRRWCEERETRWRARLHALPAPPLPRAIEPDLDPEVGP